MSFFRGRSVKLYEPKPRWGHYAAAVGGKIYMYGGRVSNFADADVRDELLSSVNVFDTLLESWDEQRTKGTSCLGLYRGTCASAHDYVYTYGGNDGSNLHGSLHVLDLNMKRWSLLSGEPCAGSPPMIKVGCGMIRCLDDSLSLFGGYCSNCNNSIQSGSSFIANHNFEDGRGWSNESHLYSLRKERWSSLQTTGMRPPPLSFFSYTAITSHHALLFGGHQPAKGYCTNDLYLMDFYKMKWTQIVPSSGDFWPIERAHHAACCMDFNGASPQLLVSGGVDSDSIVLSDIWLFNFITRKWKEIILPKKVIPRWGHSGTSVSLGNGFIEVLMFGGCSNWPDEVTTADDYIAVAETMILQLSRDSEQQWIITNIATNDERQSPHRMIKKGEQLRDMRWMHSREDEQRTGHGTESTTMIEMQAELEKAQREVETLKQKIVELEGGLASSDIVTESNCQWIIDKREIHIPVLEQQKILGHGGWAKVTVATFRKTQVAAKCFYGEIISKYNRHLFNREMNMAAKLRHPNLVQFIGATIDREPVILTELMSTSLRRVLEKQELNLLQIKCIGLDVGRALNYLHCMKPDPIIHRDVSSGNVLLDPLPGNLWKAKVADYGSVNLLKELKTVGPGSPVYAAPEATLPELQSTKMDIFSFGVLLVEMLTDRFPDVESRSQLIAQIKHNGYLRLVNMCLREVQCERPSAEMVMDELDKLTFT